MPHQEIFIGEEDERVKEFCGITGVFDPDGDPVGTAHATLFQLNHRGHEASGIAGELPDGSIDVIGGHGWVSQAYTEEGIQRLKHEHPTTALGQNRYSTSGDLNVSQPFVPGFGTFTIDEVQTLAPEFTHYFKEQHFSLAHNGNLTNAMELFDQLPSPLQQFASNDTAVAFLHLLTSEGTWAERIRKMVSKCEGAANFIINAEGKVYAYRDPQGFHPLTIGRLPFHGEGTTQGYIVSSEDNAFIGLGIEKVRDVLPGEGIVIDETGIHTFFLDERVDVNQLSQCIFELVYFAAPDSEIFGKHVSEIRRNIGKILARKDAANGFLPDVIVPVQHSGIPFAEGYAAELIYQLGIDPQRFGFDPNDREGIARKQASLQTQTGLVANNYFGGRSFIAPRDRALINASKHRPDIHVLKGKKVVLFDDSIVRGNTTKVINTLVRNSGAAEIHNRYGYPFVRHACYYGVDFQNEEELIVNRVGEKKVQTAIGADSLEIIDFRDLLEAVIGRELLAAIDHPKEEVLFQRSGFCAACITREKSYVIPVEGVYRKGDPFVQVQ